MNDRSVIALTAISYIVTLWAIWKLRVLGYSLMDFIPHLLGIRRG